MKILKLESLLEWQLEEVEFKYEHLGVFLVRLTTWKYRNFKCIILLPFFF